MNKNEVADALRGLDPRVDDHWTKAGLPALDHLESVLGYNVSRTNLKEMGFENVERENAPVPDTPDSAAIQALQHGEAAFAEETAPDAIALIEAFCAAVQTDRFRRNSSLQALARQWQVQQHAALEHQRRHDRRNSLGKCAPSEGK